MPDEYQQELIERYNKLDRELIWIKNRLRDSWRFTCDFSLKLNTRCLYEARAYDTFNQAVPLEEREVRMWKVYLIHSGDTPPVVEDVLDEAIPTACTPCCKELQRREITARIVPAYVYYCNVRQNRINQLKFVLDELDIPYDEKFIDTHF